MAKIGFSEFSYGFGFLFEQLRARWGDIRAVPILPSLNQEFYEGWDAFLPTFGTDFYYQFKISDYFTNPNSKLIKNRTYQGPYFRFGFHSKDNHRQHRILLKHAQENPGTYYIAPEIKSLDDYQEFFLSRQITQNSRIIPVLDCDPISDSKQHYITFQAEQESWFQHSDKKKHNHSYFGKNIQNLYKKNSDNWTVINFQFARSITDKIEKVIKTIFENEDPILLEKILNNLTINEKNSMHSNFQIISKFLIAFFNANLVLVGR